MDVLVTLGVTEILEEMERLVLLVSQVEMVTQVEMDARVTQA